MTLPEFPTMLGSSIPSHARCTRCNPAGGIRGMRSALIVPSPCCMNIGGQLLLQWLVYGAAATWAKAGGLTVVLSLVTMGRRYVLRRVFELWGSRQRGPLVVIRREKEVRQPRRVAPEQIPHAGTTQTIVQPGESQLHELARLLLNPTPCGQSHSTGVPLYTFSPSTSGVTHSHEAST